MADTNPRHVQVSKTLSFWLRHDPTEAGLQLDSEGWTDVAPVLAALNRTLQQPISLTELEAVVHGSDKQRFAIESGRIRANQGHSVRIDITFAPTMPPEALYHGTTRERWQRIRETGGLVKMQRHHVHMSPDIPTANRVASRHRGEHPLVLQVAAGRMANTGYAFYRSENGVYLTDRVPLEYLTDAEPSSD